MLTEVWLILHEKATEGNMAAIKLFLEYVAGKPEDEELRERLEQLEAMVNGVEQNVY